MTQRTKQRLNLDVDAEFYRRLKQASNDRMESVSAFCRRVLSRAVESEERKQRA